MATKGKFGALADAKEAAVRDWAEGYIADLRRPISLVGCGGWQKIPMMLVQVGASEVSIRVRLPHHAHQSTALPRKSIVINHVETAWDPANPDLPGFLIVTVPGWLASDRLFEQAQSPQLTADIPWTSEQLAAWDRMRKRLPKPRVKRTKEVPQQTTKRLNGYVNNGW